MSGIFSFLLFCVGLVLCIAIGGFVLNLGFALLFGLIAGLIALWQWIWNKIKLD